MLSPLPKLIGTCALKTGYRLMVVRDYYRLTKPGIIYGNALPATAGFLLASKGHFRFGLYLAMIIGLSAIIGAACVYNNYIDRELDRTMTRTKKRALVVGTITGPQALKFATSLAIFGELLLGIYTNTLTLVIALFGLVAYVWLYGVAKRRSVHGTLVGSLSGAVPPVVGYVAVMNHIDLAAGLLFIILILWQMPHFYAIAMFRSKDYRSAGLPVLPVVSGVKRTKVQIIAYAGAFVAACSLLNVFGYTGFVYLVGMIGIGLAWVVRGIQGFKAHDDELWARKMFLFSLYVLSLWSLLVGLNYWLI
jgi:protoheme IX farnesyltransferase